MLLWYPVYFADGGVPAPSLTPIWLHFRSLISGSVITPPAVTQITGGHYHFQYDVEADGEAVGVLDGGASLADIDRYQPVTIFNTRDRVLLGFDGTGQVTVGTNNDKTDYTLDDKTGFALSPDAFDNVIIDGAKTATDVFKRMAATTLGKSEVDDVQVSYFSIDDPSVPLVQAVIDPARPGVRVSVAYPN